MSSLPGPLMRCAVWTRQRPKVVARFLILRLEGPLLAFGGEMVDARGVISDFPGRAMLTGLIGNALGWRRQDRELLAGLQRRLNYGARMDREGQRLTDFQTAALGGGDKGWTTRGRPEGRAGGAGTYLGPHIRRRDYDADAAVTVVLTLTPADEDPPLDAVFAALEEPARPLFLGRKPCLPAGPLARGVIEAESLAKALCAVPLAEDAEQEALRLMLPATEAAEPHDHEGYVTDERDWHSGVHSGARRLRFRSLPRSAFKSEPAL